MVTNYYVEDDFHKAVGGIDRNLNWLVEYHLRELIETENEPQLLLFQLVEAGNSVTKLMDKSFYRQVGTGNNSM